jgi:hypothetical protein
VRFCGLVINIQKNEKLLHGATLDNQAENLIKIAILL